MIVCVAGPMDAHNSQTVCVAGPMDAHDNKTLPFGKSLGRIVPAAAMVNDFDCKHKNTNTTQLVASVYHTFFGSKQSNFRDQN